MLAGGKAALRTTCIPQDTQQGCNNAGGPQERYASWEWYRACLTCTRLDPSTPKDIREGGKREGVKKG